MQYMGNQSFWDQKFEQRSGGIMSPEKSLVENINLLKLGSVLDVACGDGRNTIYLAELGYALTGIDFSSKALVRLGRFLHEKKLKAYLKLVDLSSEQAFDGMGVFDNIVINHYRLDASKLSQLAEHLSEDGILFVSGFGEHHRVDERIRSEDLIRISDFDGLKDQFEWLKKEATTDERGGFVTFILKKVKA